jgi:hypothetical protein
MIPLKLIGFHLYQMRAGKDRVECKWKRIKERQSKMDYQSERQSIGDIWKWH